MIESIGLLPVDDKRRNRSCRNRIGFHQTEGTTNRSFFIASCLVVLKTIVFLTLNHLFGSHYS